MGYSRFDRPVQSTQRFMMMGGAPVTMAIIVICVALFVLSDFMPKMALWLVCALDHGHVLFPWTLVTYPLMIPAPNLLELLFGGLWLFGIGGSLERSWGRGRYSLFALLVALITSLSLLIGSWITRSSTVVMGLWIPLAAFTVAWAAIDPYQETLFYFVIKIQARWLAWIAIAFVFFGSFFAQPVLGLFALLGCVFAYFWVRGRVPYSVRSAFDGLGSPRRRSRGPDLRFTDVDRGRRGEDDIRGNSRRGIIGTYQAWQQRKKLEKLFRASGFGDDDNSGAKRR